jgi:secretion/DNA translocation related CpaE-like protein
MAGKSLLIMQDRALAEDVDRLAAAAGCALHSVADIGEARPLWSESPLVLLDPGTLAHCGAAGLARRPGVLVLCRGEPPPAVWREAMQIGAERVLPLPDAEPSVVGVLADAAEGATGVGRVIAVVGGRGGAGASVFVAAVGLLAARQGERVLLVDCDPLGGGLDLLLGVEQVDGLRWPDLSLAGGRVPAAALHGALPAVTPAAGSGPLTVLSCGRGGGSPAADAMASVLDAGRRAGDTVVCDLPRHMPAEASAALDRADLVVLVVPAEVRGCAAAVPVAKRLLERGCPVQAVVRGPAPGGLIPTDVARALSVPLLAAMRPAARLAAALEAGRLPLRSTHGPLARAAAVVLDAVGVCR